jgi:outer membrane lipoprotein SlyB
VRLRGHLLQRTFIMSHTHRRLSLAASAAALALLGACSSAPWRHGTASSNYGGVSEAPPVSASPRLTAMEGTVSAIQEVPASSHSSSAGAILGGIAGAVVGNQIGHGTGRAAATGAGAVGGAVIGDRIQNRGDRNDNEIYRVSVRFDDGREAYYDYQTVGDLRVGDRVRLEGGQLYRM